MVLAGSGLDGYKDDGCASFECCWQDVTIRAVLLRAIISRPFNDRQPGPARIARMTLVHRGTSSWIAACICAGEVTPTRRPSAS